MIGYLVEPDLSEEEQAAIDAMVASGRFQNRATAIVELLRLGLECADGDEN